MTISKDFKGPFSAGASEQLTQGSSEVAAAAPSMRKLHGRDFYESIGSPKFVLAPMVDQSEFAWRMLTRSFMPSASTKDLVAYTPMLHARMFGETSHFRDRHFQPLRTPLSGHADSSSPAPAQLFLDGNPALDRPLFVQFCANDPEELLNSAKYVAPFCDAVDLNLGCPQGIARKGKYGAFLQEDQGLVFSLINNLHLNLDVPVTAKIRILETKEKTLAYAQTVLRAGASILTVHGRLREAKGHKTGLADWNMIRYLRDNLPRETVLFANGNILRREDIDACLKITGADGVMSAEANLHDPAVFADSPKVGEEGREFWRGRDGKGGWRIDAVMRRYMDIIYKYVLEVPPPARKPLYLPSDPVDPIEEKLDSVAADEEEGPPRKKQRRKPTEKCSSPNLVAMQPHLFRLLRPLVGKHHNVRDALARCRAGDVAAFENVLQMVEVAVEEGLKDYEATQGKTWAEECEKDERLKKLEALEQQNLEKRDDEDEETIQNYESSVQMVKACRRPWWVVQPYVRPLPREALAKGSLTLSKKEKAAKELELGLAKIDDSVPVPSGHTELEKVGGRSEEKAQIPKEGLVCG